VLLAAAAFGAGACQLVAGLDGDFHQALAADAGTDAGSDAAGGSAPTCVSATYPDPPSGADTPANNEIVLAIRTLDLGENATVPPGYDLDHACTCFANEGPTCTSAKKHCDAPGGIDSASAQIFSLIEFGAGSGHFGSSFYSQKIADGAWTLLLRITNYNGLPDDPAVDVAAYPSNGIDPAPVWDGNDAWTVSAQSVNAGDPSQPIYTSQGAYVSNGILVAASPKILWRLGGSADTITFQLTGGVITGKLAMAAGGWTITDGIVAARWKAEDIFAAIGSYRDGNGKPICTDLGLVYGTAKSAICDGLDILADPAGAKSLPCDALSIGIGFTAGEAKLGAVEPPPTPTPGCPMTTDPTYDSCKK
jgi:hypothetical protein